MWHSRILLRHRDQQTILCIIRIFCIFRIVCIFCLFSLFIIFILLFISCLFLLLIKFIIVSIFIIFYIIIIVRLFIIFIYVTILYKYLLYLPKWKSSSVSSKLLLSIKFYLNKPIYQTNSLNCVSWLIGTESYLLYPWLLFIVKVILTYWVWP